MILLSQVAGWGLVGQIAIAVIVVAAIVAVVFIIIRKMGVAIPDWVIQIFWILVLAVVGVLAIKFLLGL